MEIKKCGSLLHDHFTPEREIVDRAAVFCFDAKNSENDVKSTFFDFLLNFWYNIYVRLRDKKT